MIKKLLATVCMAASMAAFAGDADAATHSRTAKLHASSAYGAVAAPYTYGKDAYGSYGSVAPHHRYRGAGENACWGDQGLNSANPSWACER